MNTTLRCSQTFYFVFYLHYYLNFREADKQTWLSQPLQIAQLFMKIFLKVLAFSRMKRARLMINGRSWNFSLGHYKNEHSSVFRMLLLYLSNIYSLYISLCRQIIILVSLTLLVFHFRLLASKAIKYSSMVKAYIMWKKWITYDLAFIYCKVIQFL